MKIIAIILLLIPMIADASSEQTEVRRYLLSAGANNGGRERVLLRYAVSDAKAFASVLMDMGGVNKNEAFILSNPGSRELLGSIRALNKLVSDNKTGSPDVRNEVFVYYSGHADRDGLKLGSETLSWADFRSAVNDIDADIRVAVIDACGSGAITRTKGGVAYPAFLVDASSNMRGYAFLTSSNENENSQECDRLKGSFFTHALLSGMRGAADLTGDGKVTINEAYQYAFNETLRNTQNTTSGTQHPSRDMNLAGTGDIIMTDLRETSASLTLAADIEGRFFIRDDKGNLFAELRKVGGRQTSLGIPPGKYSVQMEALSQKWMANNIVIADGQKAALAMSDMKMMERRRRTAARGDIGTPGPVPYSMSASILCLSFAYGSGDNAHLSPMAKGLGHSQFGMINIANELESSQTGLINTSKDVGRYQTGLMNTAGNVELRQIGLINTANYVGRSQTGLINIANEGGRLQVGFVNASMETGRQIGLLNFAKHSGKTPVGLISIVGNGIYDMTTYADAAGDVTASIRTGTPYFYNLIEYSSVAHKLTTEEPRAIGWGFGTRFGMKGPFTVNLDFVWQSIGSKKETVTEIITGGPDVPDDETGDPQKNTNSKPGDIGVIGGSPGNVDGIKNIRPPEVPQFNVSYDINYAARFQDYFKLRLGTSYNPHKLISVTGGVSINTLLDSYSDKIEHRPAGGFYADRKFKDFRMRFWPGAYAGLTVGKIR